MYERCTSTVIVHIFIIHIVIEKFEYRFFWALRILITNLCPPKYISSVMGDDKIALCLELSEL